MTEAARSRTSGIDRSLQILDTLSEQNRPMSAYELGKATGAAVLTAYLLVDELDRVGTAAFGPSRRRATH